MKTQIALAAMSLLLACGPKAAPLTMAAREMTFEPKEIHAARGETLRLTFENRGTVLHDWNVTGLRTETEHSSHAAVHSHEHGSDVPADIHAMAEPGSSTELQFKPLESGTYEFYCSLPGHRAAGMSGKLIVH